NANVLLTRISREDANTTYAPFATNIPIYNAALQMAVNQRRALGQRISLADLYSTISYPTFFLDGLHPTANGLAAAANEGFARLQTSTIRTDLVTTVLSSGGANWKYHDTGQDLGTAWRQNEYDDSGWSNGLARLGYGDLCCATTVSFGPQTNNKY